MLRTLVLLAICLSAAAPVLSAGIETDFLMDSDPELNYPAPVEKFDPEMAALWLQALNRPETDLQRMAAETIARAHRYGIPDLEQAVPRLEEILLSDDSHPAARYAAANALIALDSQSSADKLFEASRKYGSDLRQLAEPALAVWANESAKTLWVERLTDTDVRPRDLVLAMRGLGVVRDSSVVPDLLTITTDVRRNAGIRLEAAAAAGAIAESGLEETAAGLADMSEAPLFVNQICAVRLLARHSSDAATTLLTELAGHQEPSVAAAALQRLNEIDVNLVLPLAGSAIENADSRVRWQGVDCLLQTGDIGQIGPLTALLADPHPDLRHDVCNGLFELDKNAELSDAIRDATMGVLAGDRWQGQQEASLLLGALQHKPAATRLVELLESPHVEVRMPAAWALRRVAVPETVPGLLDRAERLAEIRSIKGDSKDVDFEVAHLLEALGAIKAEDAVPHLQLYIPKRADSRRSRAAAIWAIGKIYAGRFDAALDKQLMARVEDDRPQPLESPMVKQMAAVALARMQSVEQASTFKQFAEGQRSDTESAIRLELALKWAVRELTGEELAPVKPLTVSQGQWFLEPIR